MDALLRLPRSVHLALWLPFAAGPQAARAAAVVQDDDEPHEVLADDDVPALASPTLPGLLAAWGPRVVGVAGCLPVPGDVAGVPADVSGDAAAAGECVLVTTPDGDFAAVPDVTEFGSEAEPGHVVRWHVRRVRPWALGVVGAVGSLADAERELRTALITATDALDSLDVAQWRPDAAEALAALRSAPPSTHLPQGLDQRRAGVLALAARLQLIVDLATADDGGAVNLWQADQRTAALRHVDRAARYAVCAATLVSP